LGIKALDGKGTQSIEAYENYLKGVYTHMNLPHPISRDMFNISEQFFLKAIELDSSFADAHAGFGIMDALHEEDAREYT